ncbi:MAG: hypothetical protein K1X94_27980 [Sandaracinaceae bacterium]|nr:hypothetical protein [Sandaracinaceae bacterium]
MANERLVRVSRAETPRDMEETGFTPILRRLSASVPELQVAVFVDEEGECVDYSARIGLFDAKVAGAQIHVLTHTIVDLGSRFLGAPHAYHVVADEREILVRRVSDEYTLVLVCDPPAPLGALNGLVDAAVRELRLEGGIAPPLWEPHRETLKVELRASAGWGYAPTAFSERGHRFELTAVVGRWIDHEDQGSVCFLVRTSSGEETVLVHRAREGRWLRRVEE